MLLRPYLFVVFSPQPRPPINPQGKRVQGPKRFSRSDLLRAFWDNDCCSLFVTSTLSLSVSNSNFTLKGKKRMEAMVSPYCQQSEQGRSCYERNLVESGISFFMIPMEQWNGA
ncbi:hypothetical protein CDAR_223251 [Caerostris darwini]|uniref:Uncharacterized protein n=1 Tax=Caerostris darwini TaxID=1538125 RepID=A0AAV4N257_9ARAC|nr:hypothetical protein CDAR_223251 [Caerostris darwini]